MKLYYIHGACSLASHIMLHEVEANFEIESFDSPDRQAQSGQDYSVINPNGYVPVLDTGDGTLITESCATLQFIADSDPDKAFSPAIGSIERARLQQFLSYAASELHKSWSPLFSDSATDAEKASAVKKVTSKLDYLETVLSDGRDYFVADQFSGADAYLFVLAYWTNFKGIDLTVWPFLTKFVNRVMARPATKAAMFAEGLL